VPGNGDTSKASAVIELGAGLWATRNGSWRHMVVQLIGCNGTGTTTIQRPLAVDGEPDLNARSTGPAHPLNATGRRVPSSP
jgi:hypothetical protein